MMIKQLFRNPVTSTYIIRKNGIRKFSQKGNQLRTKWSYCSSSSNEPLLGMTIGNVIDQNCEKHRDQEAIVICHQQIRKTFSQLKQDVDSFAVGLMSLGFKYGDRIGIWSPNNYEWILTQLAAARAGLILVNVNPAYQKRELEYCLQSSGMSGIIMPDKFKTQDFYGLLNQVIPTLPHSKAGNIQDEKIPNLKHVIVISQEEKSFSGTYKFNEVFNIGQNSSKKELEDLQDKIQFDHPINIQYTSGTTGTPKGATLTHHNILNNCYFACKRMGYFDTHHRICVSVPLYHCFGCVMGVLAGVMSGNCTVYPYYIFNAIEVAKNIQKEKATVIYGTPTMYIDILNLSDFKNYDFSSLCLGLVAGSPCPEQVANDMKEKLHLKNLLNAYGSTELSPLVTMNHLGDGPELLHTVGGILPHTELKVVNEHQEIVPLGSRGEIWARGYGLMYGYWNDKEKTSEVITPDRWYKTGDIGTMDENGYLKIAGRIKDMIIRGGENIYPREIEELLHLNDKIAEAQVVGVPDTRMGEEICAWIKLKSGENMTPEEVCNFCKGKISHFKIPRYILFVDEFPKTVTGKIQKHVMRQKNKELLKNIKTAQ